MEFDWVKKINADSEYHSQWLENNSRKQVAEWAQNDKDRNTASEIIALKNKVKEYEDLLSRPMKEIAQASGGFKKTYETLVEAQDEVLANWIVSQKAFRETAKVLAAQLDKTPEEFTEIHQSSINAVLTNQTQHENNGNESPLLERHAAAILAIRKKQGKA
ncbi:hypothetical protein [Undibacterium sp. Xuan67W]|uniref:hypothetical protein n=1 Tax=Undibacterium sp. Xuan67W TaxID=3413057 RepID=UPI003BF38550